MLDLSIPNQEYDFKYTCINNSDFFGSKNTQFDLLREARRHLEESTLQQNVLTTTKSPKSQENKIY